MLGRTGKIYLRTDDGGLLPLVESQYSAEVVLQELLASYPDLLAGDQMLPAAPRRWLLVTREASIPDSQQGAGRWSLDHLFLDQEAVPTLVEVKRSTDTRIRREVVGQMLDYAANVAAHWAPGQIRLMFEQRCRADGVDPNTLLASFIEPDGLVAADEADEVAIDSFWQRASDNLASRRLRLLFVADVIPPELQRIIEFLNESMIRMEVLGVEVRQFVGEGRQTLVPRVIGQTAAAAELKRPGTLDRSALDEPSLLEILRDLGNGEDQVAQELLDWARQRNLRIWWGKTVMSAMWDHPKGRGYEFTFDINRKGIVSVSFELMARRPTFAPIERRDALRARLNEVPGLALGAEVLESFAEFPLIKLKAQTAERAFMDVLDWMLGQYEVHWAGPEPTA